MRYDTFICLKVFVSDLHTITAKENAITWSELKRVLDSAT
ncbi:hypothetical protein ACUY4Q_002833 [Phytobacter sp. AG2a]